MKIFEQVKSNGEVEYRIRYWRYTIFTAWVLMSLVFFTQVVAPEGLIVRLFVTILFVSCVFLSCRAFRMGTIVAWDEGMIVRAFYRTRHLPWSRIAEFRAERRTGGHGQPGEVLAIGLKDGNTLKAGEFFDKRVPGVETSVARLAESLNARLDQQQAPPAPGA
jgi:hypothetical protein